MRAAIASAVQWPNVRHPDQRRFWLEAHADLAADLLADAGIDKDEIDGLFLAPFAEQPMMVPAGVAEYLGLKISMGEVVDLGGATAAGAVWRAAMAVEAGVCQACLVLYPHPSPPMRAGAEQSAKFSIFTGGDAWGAPQAQYEFPSGLVAAIPSYAMIARRYLDDYGVSQEALAAVAVEQRHNAQGNPNALFRGRPLSVADVMAAPMLCDPVKLPEVVMPCFGGMGVLVTTEGRAKAARHRPVLVTGYGERITQKSLTYAEDLLHTPLREAAASAFTRAGTTPGAMDFAAIYDCFTVVVPLSLENAGFCKPGQGLAFMAERGIRFDDGGFPVNPGGGQLGGGQAGHAGGGTHVYDAVVQIQGRATGRQVAKADTAFVNGTGGLMSEQVALILEGA